MQKLGASLEQLISGFVGKRELYSGEHGVIMELGDVSECKYGVRCGYHYCTWSEVFRRYVGHRE
jgi:hypothetical protein